MKKVNNLQLFETILEQSPISTYVYRSDGKIALMNTASKALWNTKSTYYKDYNILTDERFIKNGAMTYIKKAFKGKSVLIPPIKYMSLKTNSKIPYKWLQTSLYPIKDETNKILYIVLQHEDITEKKLIEEGLQESQQRLKAIWDSAGDAVALSDPNGIILEANPAYSALYGYKLHEIIGKDFSLIFPKNVRKTALLSYKKAFYSKKVLQEVVTDIERKDGSRRTVQIRYTFLKQQHKRIAMLSIVRDITKQKQVEIDLRSSEERLRLALEAGKIGVWDWNQITGDLTWSKRVYELFDANPETFQLTIKNFVKQIHPDDKNRTELAMQEALAGIKPFDISYRIVTLSGKTKWIYTNANIQRDSKGKTIRMLGATSDITEQKNSEQDKNDFISIATHELKTPVTSIKAYAEMLERKFIQNSDAVSADQLGKMNVQLDKLTGLISDLLDASKTETGKLQMNKEKFVFATLISDITEELQRTTGRHRITILGRTNKHIFGDRDRIGQVLTNLISNAIKYSPATKDIIIKVTSGAKNIRVSVQDFGVGIPAKNHAKLFERFYRASSPRDNAIPGLGLGLYISHEIIKRHKGKIWFTSKVNKGSTFSFSLPTGEN